MEMSQINPKNHKFIIMGIQESGKTYFSKWLVKNKFKKPIIYTPHLDEWNKENVYKFVPTNKDKVIEELQQQLPEFCEEVKDLAKEGKIDVVIFDEADLFFKSNFDINPKLHDLILNHRHYGLAMGFLTRRPQDIPTKITESSLVLFIFKLEGANALQKLKEISKDIVDLMEELDFKKHNFIIKQLGEKPFIQEAIDYDK